MANKTDMVSTGATRRLTGCIPVLLTPFKPDRSVDFEALSSLTERAINAGVEGLWILGTGSEDMAMRFEDRWHVAEHLATRYASNVKLLIGCGFDAMDDTLDFAERLNGLDIHAVHYMPYQSLMGLDAVERNYRTLATTTRHPVWLYTSDNWGRALPPTFLDRFEGEPQFEGCKFSTSNIVKFEAAMRRDRDGFQVIPAVVKQLLPALTLGAEAFTTVEANLFLDAINGLLNAFKCGDLVEARHRQTALNRTLERSITASKHQNFLRNAEIKAVLEHQGHCPRWMARGYIDIDADDIPSLVKAYDDLMADPAPQPLRQ